MSATNMSATNMSVTNRSAAKTPAHEARAARQQAALLWEGPASATLETDTPWVPLSEGRAFKPIRFMKDDRGYVALMRVDPGVTIPPHRHSGEVHAFNLSGYRELCSGEVIGPGDYVYEPAGNVDTWKTSGDEPVIVLIVVYGSVEYLAADGSVAARFSGAGQEAIYRRFCEERGLPARDLTD